MIAALLVASVEVADPLEVAPAVKQQCPSADRTQIVVCAPTEPDRKYRLPKAATQYEAPLIRIGGKAAELAKHVHLEQVGLAQGAKSNRIMFTFGIGF